MLIIVIITFLGLMKEDVYATAMYDSTVEEANALHKELNSIDVSTNNIKQFMRDDINEDLLTDNEIEELLNTSKPPVKTITKIDAKDDVNLLFRALKSAYCGYYYFGESKYQDAENKTYQWIDDQHSTIEVNQLKKQLRGNLDFMRDAHALVGLKTESLNDFQYVY